MGQLISLGVAVQEDLFAHFTYNDDSSLASKEQRRNETSIFIRQFVYNSVGFLRKLSDPFLEQGIEHTDGGYGQPDFGDEHISLNLQSSTGDPTTPTTRWINWEKRAESTAGILPWALETASYMSKSGEPIREFHRRVENGFPLVCNYGDLSRRLINWQEKKRRPATYGHSYAFCNHRHQLVISRPATSTSRCSRTVFIFGQAGR